MYCFANVVELVDERKGPAFTLEAEAVRDNVMMLQYFTMTHNELLHKMLDIIYISTMLNLISSKTMQSNVGLRETMCPKVQTHVQYYAWKAGVAPAQNFAGNRGTSISADSGFTNPSQLGCSTAVSVVHGPAIDTAEWCHPIISCLGGTSTINRQP